jgi:bifunctional UDP-N-acetylglucosamine pyrophosphorylase/glucosamine-1-phosphate N-acetyltransferase
MTDLTTIILAAGEGTRMKASKPKLLHPVAGLPIIGHVVSAALEAGSDKLAVVTGPGHEKIQAAAGAVAPKAEFFEQTERRGTAHAALMAEPAWRNAKGIIAIVYGDHPLLRADSFKLVLERIEAGKDAAILGFEPEDPTGYGRFLTDGDRLLEIREHKDASEEERKITLCNACILAFKADIFRDAIHKIDDNNAQNEFYLGDLVVHANAAGADIGYAIAPEEDVMGVNSQSQRAAAETAFQNRLRRKMLDNGTMMIDPNTVYFSYDTVVGRDVTIEPNVFFGPAVEVGDGVEIRAYSHIECATIGAGAQIGPFARLRPGADLASNTKVGNFVEVKNAKVGVGAKLNHLSYIGDADVGDGTNIGAGTITCNYDGINKHRTRIGEGVFVGSNSSLVAPVEIGNNAYIGSGSIISQDVPEDALALGRARQENKPGYAPKLRARAQAIKNRK